MALLLCPDKILLQEVNVLLASVEQLKKDNAEIERDVERVQRRNEILAQVLGRERRRSLDAQNLRSEGGRTIFWA